MNKTKLLSTIISLVIFIGFTKAQSHTFIALDNAGNLYEVNTDSCKSTKLTICTNFKGKALSIAMDGTTIFIVDNQGYLYSNTIGATGTTKTCTILGQFKSKSTAIYGMTVGPGGVVYAASDSVIETYTPATPTTGTFATLGHFPKKWTIGGDLLFYKGVLYEAVQVNGSATNDALIQVNLSNPYTSTLYMNFIKGTKVFGFASVTVPCSNNQAFALSDTGKNTDIYAVDMINKVQSPTPICTLPYNVNDAASVAETQSATPPVSPTVVSPVNYCQNDPVSPLSATVASNIDTLKWYTVPVNGTATGKPVPTVSSATIGSVKYYVSDFDTSTKCESTRDSIIVTVSAYPAVPTINPLGPDTICTGSTLLLTSSALAANINQWYVNNNSIAGATSTTYTANAAGNYTIKTSTPAGCSKTSVPSIVGLTQATISYPGSPFCPVGTKAVVFSGDTGGRYTVLPAGLVIDSITGTINLATSKSGAYTVTYTVGPAHCPFTTTLTVQPQTAGISYSKPTYCKAEANQTVIFAPGSLTTGIFSSSPAGLSISTGGTINPTASNVGTYQILYTYGTAGVGCGIMTTIDSVSITSGPTVPPITGLNKLCTGSTITLADTLQGGVWTTSDANVATVSGTGLVTAIASGNVTITYSVTNSCGTASQSQPVAITNGPVTQPVIGANTVCITKSITLSDATNGGIWTSSDNTIATINNGIVSGVAPGTVTITYSVTNTCGVAAQTQTVTVNAPPVVGQITGNDSVCVNSTLQLSDTTANGIWTVGNTSASINNTGLATGLSSGNNTISYAVTNTCGTTIQTKNIIINDVPVVGIINGNTSVCVNSTAQLSDNTTGGVWSSSNNANATVSTTGLVTGVAAGTSTMFYSVTNSCGTTTKTYLVTINDVPVVGAINGNDSVCSGSPVQLSDATNGGIWTSSNPAAATVNNTGLVTGTGVGNTTISYALTNTCGTTTQTKLINANSIPVVGLISGNNVVCVNSTVQLTETTSGGVWSSGNPAVATISTTGLVSGITSDTTHIYYAVTNSCGTTTTSYYVRVNDVPVVSAITGKDSVCSGSPIQLSDATNGGIWTSSNPAAATVNTSGLVTGVSAGNTTISYALTNMCGTTTQTKLINANSIPVVSPVNGSNAVCVNSTIQLSDNTSGGIWTSSNTAAATVSNTGLVTGVAIGNATITYAVSNSCGTTTQTIAVVVNDVPVVSNINGNSAVCANSTIQLTDNTAGGIWTSSNPGAATINNTGLVAGVSSGTTVVTYAVTNTCGTTSQSYNITINDVPLVDNINGNNTLCVNATTQLTETTSGGVWSSTNPASAMVSNSGLVTGIATGNTTIAYSVTNTCGTTTKSIIITTNDIPVVKNIVGNNTVCTNATIQLTDATPGGSWSSSNLAFATVNNGLVTGIVSGTSTIIYTVTNSCGTTSKSINITINTIPVVNAVTGDNTVCTNNTIQLSDLTTGGTWSSNNPAAATISNSGLVTGVATGSAIITYSLTNNCGTASQTSPVNVNAVPVVSNITGNNAVCVNSTIQLSDNTTGGIWTSSNPSSAVVNNNGLLIGVASGTTTVSYAVTNTCGTTTQSTVVTTNDVPVVNNITGNNIVCANVSIQLSDVTLGGTWSSSNLTNATVTNSGLVTGIALGTSTISYAVTNVCGTTTQTYIITINDVPPITGIIGNNNICINSVSQLTDLSLGGIWSSSNIAVAPVSTIGLVAGIANGNAIITYSITNVCGTSSKTMNVNVISPPVKNPITGTDALCANSTAALSEATGGGVWTCSNTAVATVNSIGVVFGISTGAAIITYTVKNACGTDVETHPVTIYPIPNSAFYTDPVVPTVCVGNPITFTDNSVGATVIKSVWYFGNNSLDTGLSVTYTYPDATTYWVTHKIVDQNGCVSNPSTILVTIDSLPVVTLPHLVYVLQNDSTTLYPVISGLDYNATTVWTPDVYLSNSQILNPVCTPLNDTTYTLTVTSSIGCKGSDTIRIVVLSMDPIPNVFSPNGDGIHDIWDIPALHKYPSVKLKVFDRNGHVIYSCNDRFKAWDGKYNGQDVPFGTYWYMIDRGFHLPLLSGSVTIIR